MGFVINGKIIYCHQFNHANIETNVYMSTPNLPIRYEIINEGTGPEDHLDHICCSVISEGGRQILGTTFGLNRDTSSLSVSDGSLYPVIGLKLGSSYLGSTIELLDFSLICTSSAEYAWYLILNPTEAGTALSWTPLTNSSVEYTYPANVSTISGGTILSSGIGSDTAQVRAGSVKSFHGDIGLGSNIDYTPDRVFLAVRRLTGATETFYASLNFRDIN